ncbi:MAG: sulfotransferase family 2 domain-containing protein [Leptolyngbyaceae bacterium]|nr:sulfotransferase family 2 domain-containing protein [Leptolyngbyaceae bacterium]
MTRQILNENNHQKFLIFLHIQKTGGITIQRILRRKLGQSLITRISRSFQHQDQADSLIESLKAKTSSDRYFIGHSCYGIHQYLPHPFTYMSLLREPVSRIVSLYYFSKSNSTAYYHEHAVDKSLEDFALNTPLMELDNGQVRFIAGDEQDCFINRTPFGECSEQLLEHAKQNIEKHFSLIGLTEYFDQSILLMGTLMGWNNCLYLKRNISRSKAANVVSQQLREAIAQQNWLDIQLYEYVKQRFFIQLAKHNLDKPTLLQNFQTQNRKFNQYLNYPYTAYDRLKALLRGQIGRPS